MTQDFFCCNTDVLFIPNRIEEVDLLAESLWSTIIHLPKLDFATVDSSN